MLEAGKHIILFLDWLIDFFNAYVSQRFLMFVITNIKSDYSIFSIPLSKIVAFTISIIVLPIFLDILFSF